MRKMILVLGAMFLMLSFAVPCVADEKGNSADTKTIEQKKAAIQKIMSQGQFKAYIQDDEKFCAAFLDDFTKQIGIEYIKPIVEVDDYNDPKLKTYREKCPELEFNKDVVYLSRWQNEGEGSEDEGIKSYATKNFKLYKVNMDNNPRNGDEYVFYAEGYYNEILKRYDDHDRYSIIDMEKCETTGSVYTADPFDYEKQQPRENYNAIIKYKGKYHVFELKDWGGTWFFRLESYKKEIKKMNYICAYRDYSKKGGN